MQKEDILTFLREHFTFDEKGEHVLKKEDVW